MSTASSITFSMTDADSFMPSYRGRLRRSTIWGRLCLAIILTLILYEQWMIGIRPLLVIASIYLVVQLIFPHFLARVIWHLYVKRRDRTIHLAWDDEKICVTFAGNTVDYLWKSLSRFGRAEEFDDGIVVFSVRGAEMPFPKRSFASEADLNEFRRFVAEKMGDRFHSELKDRELNVAATE